MAKPFQQRSQKQMQQVMGHPVKNLGTYAHQPKGRHQERRVPTPDTQGDFKPAGDMRENLHSQQTDVSGVDMGNSDVKSESIGADLGPATTTPKAYKKKPNLKRQMSKVKTSGTPFFGNAVS